MPTVLREKGYRFFFFLADVGEPPHVHVFKDGHEAKFWLRPIRLARNDGFRDHELGEVSQIITKHLSMILEQWHERFGS